MVHTPAISKSINEDNASITSSKSIISQIAPVGPPIITPLNLHIKSPVDLKSIEAIEETRKAVKQEVSLQIAEGNLEIETHISGIKEKDDVDNIFIKEELIAVDSSASEKKHSENYGDIVSVFIGDILEDVEKKSLDSDDSLILSYINNLLQNLVEELQVSYIAEKENIIKKSLEYKPQSENQLPKWHIPNQECTFEEPSKSLETWYIPSWSKMDKKTVTLDDMPDILTTLRTSVSFIKINF